MKAMIVIQTATGFVVAPIDPPRGETATAFDWSSAHACQKIGGSYYGHGTSVQQVLEDYFKDEPVKLQEAA